MASNVSLTSVLTEVRQRTHYEQSQFVTDAELTAWINRSLAELYDLLVTAYDGYQVSQADSTIASGNTFAVPATFYKLLGVDWLVSSPDQLQKLPRVGWGDRNTGQTGYDLRGATVVILPYSWAAGKTFRLYYVPVVTQLVNPADTFDGVSGWEEYVIVDVCLKVLAKAERDPSLFLQAKQAMLDRIQAHAKNRDAGEPPHVQDVRTQPGAVWMGGRVIFDP